MAPPPISPHSPLQSLDMNRRDHRRSRDSQWTRPQKGTSPTDILRTEAFPYSPSAPPLSIDKGSSSRVKPMMRCAPNQASPASFSPSSASSYGSYIGSHLYGNPVAAGWNVHQGSSRFVASRHGIPHNENESSISSRLASSSIDGSTRLTPAPAMQRQLSSRSNDGFLFPAEDIDLNHDPDPMFTPDDSSAPPHHTAIVPRPFPLHIHDEDTGPVKRRESSEKHGLALESPWKSPGWKLREKENMAANRTRDRSGSVLGMTMVEEEDNEIPKACLEVWREVLVR